MTWEILKQRNLFFENRAIKKIVDKAIELLGVDFTTLTLWRHLIPFFLHYFLVVESFCFLTNFTIL